jgi:hypothetical protein
LIHINIISELHLDLPNGIISVGYLAKIINEFLIWAIQAACHVYVIILGVIILLIIWEKAQSMKFSIV